jgi:hypothetical protein
VFIVHCIPEDAKEPPFGVVVDQPVTLGMEIRPGGGVYVVTEISRSDELGSRVESVRIRKILSHSDNVRFSLHTAPMSARSDVVGTDTV